MAIIETSKSLPELRAIVGAAASRAKLAKSELDFQLRFNDEKEVAAAKAEVEQAEVALHLANCEVWFAMEMTSDSGQRSDICHAAVEAGLVAV